jgi:GNAT superfamily N-acetyltransferase
MIIRRPIEADRASWDRLYAGYAAFYKVAQTPEMRDRVWNWILDRAHSTEAFVADQDGNLVGLAHFRPFARPLMASTGCYLDDLFVDHAARGSGAADALLNALAEESRQRKWTVIRWITGEDNFRARAVYERLAQRTNWVTYDIRIE